MTMLKGVQVNRPKDDGGALGPACDAAELRALDAGYVRQYCTLKTNYSGEAAYAAQVSAPRPPLGTGAGVQVVPYMESAGQGWSNPAQNAQWIAWIDAWIRDLGPYCDTFEWLNEPNFKSALGSSDSQKFAHTLYLYRLVLPRFHAAGKKLLLSASGQQQTTAWLNQVDADTQAPPGGATGPMFSGSNPVAADGVCIHSYASDVSTGAPSVLSKFNAARAQVPSTIGIWITEVGWGTDPPWVGPTHAWVKTAAGQASRVDALWDVMRTKEASPNNLKGISYFIWKDYDDGSAQWAGPYGLRYSPRASLTPTPNAKKPSWQMFANWPASWGSVASTWPTVTTTFGVTNLTQTSVTVSGTVDPNLLPTNRFFDWGLTAGYGNSSPAVSVGSGDVAVNVSYTITGLTPGTTYHYQCRAVNSAGVGTGTDRTFTTDAPPLAPTVTTGSATNVTIAGATLNGIVDPNGLATLAYFEYGPTTSYGSRTPATDIAVGSGFDPVSVSAPLTGLTIGATVHYRLRATNALG